MEFLCFDVGGVYILWHESEVINLLFQVHVRQTAKSKLKRQHLRYSRLYIRPSFYPKHSQSLSIHNLYIRARPHLQPCLRHRPIHLVKVLEARLPYRHTSHALTTLPFRPRTRFQRPCYPRNTIHHASALSSLHHPPRQQYTLQQPQRQLLGLTPPPTRQQPLPPRREARQRRKHTLFDTNGRTAMAEEDLGAKRYESQT